MAKDQRIVTLSVASREEVNRRVLHAFSDRQQGERITFASVSLLWKILTIKRLDILKAMAGQGGLTMREVARRVERDVKAVHGDIHALLDAGIIELRGDGRVQLPYDAVHVEFTLSSAA